MISAIRSFGQDTRGQEEDSQDKDQRAYGPTVPGSDYHVAPCPRAFTR